MLQVVPVVAILKGDLGMSLDDNCMITTVECMTCVSYDWLKYDRATARTVCD